MFRPPRRDLWAERGHHHLWRLLQPADHDRGRAGHRLPVHPQGSEVGPLHDDPRHWVKKGLHGPRGTRFCHWCSTGKVLRRQCYFKLQYLDVILVISLGQTVFDKNGWMIAKTKWDFLSGRCKNGLRNISSINQMKILNVIRISGI